jgi:hypothetical protein
MARWTIPPGWIEAINRISQTDPWAWLWEIEADKTETARTLFRLVSHTEEIKLENYEDPLGKSYARDGSSQEMDPIAVSGPGFRAFGLSTQSDAQITDLIDPRYRSKDGEATFYPYPIKQDAIELNSDGDLPSMTLTVDNATRALTRNLQKGDAFMDRAALGILVNTKDLRERLFFTFQIVGASASVESVTFSLEIPNLMLRSIPEDRYDARRCRYAFGGPLCGYPITATAGFATCNKTIGDCRKRGDDEVARGLGRQHPARIGAFPGIPNK